MELVTFNEIAEFTYGSIPNKSLISSHNKYPIWSGYLITDYYPFKNIDKGDLIVVARGVGGTGDVKIAKQDSWLTNLSIKVHITSSEIINQYLVYKFAKNNLRFLDSGSAQSQITINDLKKLQFHIHSIEEQRHIVNTILSHFFF